MAGYNRQELYVDGDVIEEFDTNNEFDVLVTAFSNTAGHKHDGSALEGPVIALVGDAGVAIPINKVVVNTTDSTIDLYVSVGGTSTKQFVIKDGAVEPHVNNDMDLGSSAKQFKNLYIDGIAYIDSLVADTADINGGTVDNTTIGGTTPAVGTFTNVVATTVDINGGNIDATQIGAASASTVIGTTVTATNFVGPIAGAVTGNVTGNTAGVHTGAVSGDVAGNVTAGSGSSSFNNVTINGSLDMNAGTSATITGLSNPVQGSDAATKTYVDSAIAATVAAAPAALDTLNELAAALGDDANYAATTTAALATKLPLAGGTLSGALAMGTSKITGLGTPTAGTDASTKAYVDTGDALKVTKAGDTMSGVLAMGANKITGVADPTTAQDAATKSYIDTLYGSTANAATSAGNAATSATNAANSATASANSATASASSESGASTSATNAAASLASFVGQYVAQSSTPSSANLGDLWFDTTAGIMKVYSSSGFVNAGSSVNGVDNSVQHTATAGQTSFTATYDAGFLQVFLNGIRLDAEDYTASNGSTVVLDVAATVNDVVFIHSFGTFLLSDHYTKTAADARYALITAESGGYSSKTLSTSVSVDANTHYLTGSNLIINNGVVLTIPVSSIVEVAYYATQKQL